jgi:hypothetical protein
MTSPYKYRSMSVNDFLKEHDVYMRYMRKRYLVGLFHPDLAVKQHLGPKLASDMPLPSSTLGLTGVFEGTTNASGNALITIAPPGLPGKDQAMQNITFNNNASLDSASIVSGNNFINSLPNNEATGSIQRYRVVSSLVRVSYVGPVLNTSGRFQSCVTLDPLGINYATSGTTTAQPLADRFGNFSLIRNGYWNRSVDVASSNSMEFLYIPLDKNSTVFEKQWSYGGTIVPAADTIMQPQEQFTKMSHIVAAIGLPANSKVLVEQWTNYELLVDPSAVAYFGPGIDNPLTSQDMSKVQQTLTESPEQLVRTGTSKHASFMDVLMKIGEIAGPAIAKLLL